jgi:hypothetical protein
MLVRGEARAVSADHMRVGGLDVPLASDTAITKLHTGDRVLVSGRMINGSFVPDVITGGNGLPFQGPVADVSLEGYAPAKGDALKLDGMTLQGGSLPPGVTENDRIVVTGRVSAPDQITASAITKIRTVVTIMRARGAQRPAAVRPETNRPDRVMPERVVPERPEGRPEGPPERPPIEHPTGGMTGV